MRPTTVVGGLAALQLAAAIGLHVSRQPRPIRRTAGAAALAVNFQNFGEVHGELGAFVAAADPADPVRTFHWRDPADLERGLRDVFARAAAAGLDGTRSVDGRRGALDLVFASTHSATVVVPGAGGERVGAVVSDRAQPSPARAGLLAVCATLTARDAGRFPQVRVHTVFLLNCGSVEDHGDHRAIDRMIRALTGAPPTRILATAAKVNPDYRFVTAGHATFAPLTLYDVRPQDGSVAPRAVLHIGQGGHWHFGTGAGTALALPADSDTTPTVAIDPTTE